MQERERESVCVCVDDNESELVKSHPLQVESSPEKKVPNFASPFTLFSQIESKEGTSASSITVYVEKEFTCITTSFNYAIIIGLGDPLARVP